MPGVSWNGECIPVSGMLEEPEPIANLWVITRIMQDGLTGTGFGIGRSGTSIIPIHFGQMEDDSRIWRGLTGEGLFVNPVVPPAVPPGDCLIRTSYMATHTKEQMTMALEIFRKVGRGLDLVHA